MSNAQQPADERAELENRLKRLYDLLGHFDGLQQQKEAVYQRYQHWYLGYKIKWRAGMYWLWVLILTMVLSVVAVMVFTASVAGWNAGYGAGEPSTEDMAAQMSVLLVFLLPLPVALVASGILVGARNARVPKVNAQREQLNQERAAQVGEATAPKAGPIEAQLGQARQELNAEFRGWFPEKYLTAEDVEFCWQLVHDHRASTVENAIKEYETVLHRRRIENMAAAQLAEQQRTAKVAMLGNVINAAGYGATIGTIRSEGAVTRAAMLRRVYVRKR